MTSTTNTTNITNSTEEEDSASSSSNANGSNGITIEWPENVSPFPGPSGFLQQQQAAFLRSMPSLPAIPRTHWPLQPSGYSPYIEWAKPVHSSPWSSRPETAERIAILERELLMLRTENEFLKRRLQLFATAKKLVQKAKTI